MGETDDFEWDDDKDEANQRKHGLPLRFAEIIVADPLHLDLTIGVDRAGEVRRMAIGRVGQAVLCCVYVWRRTKRRAISLRPASRKERRAYETEVDASGPRE